MELGMLDKRRGDAIIEAATEVRGWFHLPGGSAQLFQFGVGLHQSSLIMPVSCLITQPAALIYLAEGKLLEHLQVLVVWQIKHGVQTYRALSKSTQ